MRIDLDNNYNVYWQKTPKPYLKTETKSAFKPKKNSLPKGKFKYIPKIEAKWKLKPEAILNLDKLDKPEKLKTRKSWPLPKKY